MDATQPDLFGEPPVGDEPPAIQARANRLHDADECGYWLVFSRNELRWLDSKPDLSDELRAEVRAHLAQWYLESDELYQERMKD